MYNISNTYKRGRIFISCLSIITFVILLSVFSKYWYIIIPIALIIYSGSINLKKKEKDERTKKLSLLVDKLEEEGLPLVSTSLILNPRERCYYHDKGSRLITSRRVTSYKGGSAGVSVRVVKGVTLRSGNSRGVPIRNDVTDRFNGEIVITNQRIVFLGDKGFEIIYGQITAIDYYSDAIAFQVKSNRYVISAPEIDYIQVIVDEVVERYKLRRA